MVAEGGPRKGLAALIVHRISGRSCIHERDLQDLQHVCQNHLGSEDIGHLYGPDPMFLNCFQSRGQKTLSRADMIAWDEADRLQAKIAIALNCATDPIPVLRGKIWPVDECQDNENKNQKW